MKTKRLTAFCAGILLAGLAGSALVMQKPEDSTVRIVQDGVVLFQTDLQEAEDQTLSFVYEGRSNTVEIRDHQIRVAEADCPDRLCVETGWLRTALPIVCLPNHLVIEFADEAQEADIAVR
ncbi:MAG: NusG domain II-containing protein [Eubacteriales bacterium]|nr:NusG domain II-containing protein [Eubacteriales bacterium]